MQVTSHHFGTTAAGEKVTLYRLMNRAGMSVELLDYGCTIRSIHVPNGAGGSTDVVLGYDTVAEYEANDGYFGAVVGRFANRIGGASFSLGKKTYPLCQNDGKNCLHGGKRGFDKYVWAGSPRENSVLFSRCSPDGEEGFPGSLGLGITYSLNEDNQLVIRYYGKTDQDTIVSMTNHSYFNLAGKGSVLTHRLTLFSDAYCECTGECLPTGRILPVAHTPLDFSTEKEIGRDLNADWEQTRQVGGYDHNFVLRGEGMKKAACLFCPDTGIKMEVSTTLPGVQLYSGNFIGKRRGKMEAEYESRSGVCLETQFYPDTPNQPSFPSCVLKRGDTYSHTTVYAFDWTKV
jgi:aldose 1-epimerase